MVGLQTQFERTAEAAKKFAESQKAIKEATDKINNITGDNKAPPSFAFLPAGKSEEADSALATLTQQHADAEADLKAASDRSPTADRGFITNFQFNLTRDLGLLADQRGNDALVAAEKLQHQSAVDAAAARIRFIQQQIDNRKNELAGTNFTAGLDLVSSNASTWGSIFGNLGKALTNPFELIAGKFDKGFADEAKQRAEQGRKIYEETRTPLEKHANEMGELHDLLDAGTISPELFARRKQQLDLDYEKSTTFDQTPSRMPSQHGGMEGLPDFARQLQDSILGNDPATGTEQKKANVHLQNIDDNLKAAASAEFMFA
jgi:hypothetical protein